MFLTYQLETLHITQMSGIWWT